jgi:hypothetical protein
MELIEKIEITLTNGKKATIKKDTIDGDYIMKIGNYVVLHGESIDVVVADAMRIYADK